MTYIVTYQHPISPGAYEGEADLEFVSKVTAAQFACDVLQDNGLASLYDEDGNELDLTDPSTWKE